jgi:hypothetical protein
MQRAPRLSVETCAFSPANSAARGPKSVLRFLEWLGDKLGVILLGAFCSDVLNVSD